MKNIFHSVTFVALTSSAITACGGGTHWMAAPVQAGGIEIQTTDVRVTSSRLQVRTNVFNRGGVPLVVNRDAVSLTLPNGTTLQRSSGTTSIHAPYFIPPGGSHQVFVDFRAEGFSFRDLPGGQVNWIGAITVNGQPVAVPPTALQPQQ